jgi:sec-independent protein translocase protein TatA
MQFGLPEILIIAVLVILLFGVGRIGKVGGELGRGIREFRSAIKDGEPDESAVTPGTTATPVTENKSAA